MKFLQNSFSIFSGELPQSNTVALCLIAAVVHFSQSFFSVPFLISSNR